MGDKPILFSGPMVRAILEGRKTQTRRVLDNRWPVLGERFPKKLWSGLDFDRAWARSKSPISGAGDAHIAAPWCHPDDGDVRSIPVDEACIYRVRPPIQPGDRLWCREAWQAWADFDGMKPSEIPPGSDILYSVERPNMPWDSRNRPSMFMPRWASRITLLVTDVRVQRLQDISRDDVIAEGITGIEDVWAGWHEPFAALWDSINGKRTGCDWQSNPWVAAYTFKPILQNIDAVGGKT